MFVNVEELKTILKLRAAPVGERVIGGCKSPKKIRKVKRTYRAPLINVIV